MTRNEDRRYDEAARPHYLLQTTVSTPKTIKQANKRYKRTTKREMLTSSVNDQKAASHGRNESVPDSNKTMTILDLGSASMLRSIKLNCEFKENCCSGRQPQKQLISPTKFTKR